MNQQQSSTKREEKEEEEEEKQPPGSTLPSFFPPSVAWATSLPAHNWMWHWRASPPGTLSLPPTHPPTHLLFLHPPTNSSSLPPPIHLLFSSSTHPPTHPPNRLDELSPKLLFNLLYALGKWDATHLNTRAFFSAWSEYAPRQWLPLLTTPQLGKPTHPPTFPFSTYPPSHPPTHPLTHLQW